MKACAQKGLNAGPLQGPRPRLPTGLPSLSCTRRTQAVSGGYGIWVSSLSTGLGSGRLQGDLREHATAGALQGLRERAEGRAGAPAARATRSTGLHPGPRAQPALRRPWGQARPARPRRAPPSPWSPFPLALVQEGGGEAWGRTTGAKALFCFTAEMTLAGENEKMPWALLQFEGRVTEEAAMVGLDGTTATKQTRSGRAAPCGHDTQTRGPPGTAGPGTACRCPRGPLSGQQASAVSDSVPMGRPRVIPSGFGFGSGFPMRTHGARLRSISCRQGGRPASTATLPRVQ